MSLEGKVLWEEWVDQHFDLRDHNSVKSKMGMRKHSDLIPPAQVVGTPEGYLICKLKRGQTYSLDYVPKRAEPKRYRHVFVAPDTDIPVSRESAQADIVQGA